jgi:hypothetical protein
MSPCDSGVGAEPGETLARARDATVVSAITKKSASVRPKVGDALQNGRRTCIVPIREPNAAFAAL